VCWGLARGARAFGAIAGIASSSLVALNAFHIHHSQEVTVPECAGCYLVNFVLELESLEYTLKC
jgi:hypothetical protein